MRRIMTLAAASLALAVGGAACGSDNSAPPVNCGSLGAACTLDTDCCVGLKCGSSNACEPRGDLTEGEPCTLTAECAAGLYCGPERVCAQVGTVALGGDCATTADCERGLVCAIEGMGFVCRPAGTGGTGTTCVSDSDCQAGLSCLPAPGGAHQCGSAPALDGGTQLPSIPVWAGETCEADDGDPRGYFDVPRWREPLFPLAGEHHDQLLVLISVGAGFTGIALAYYLYVARPGTADRIGDCLDRLVLADHTLVEPILHVDELGHLALEQLRDRDPRPGRVLARETQ